MLTRVPCQTVAFVIIEQVLTFGTVLTRVGGALVPLYVAPAAKVTQRTFTFKPGKGIHGIIY